MKLSKTISISIPALIIIIALIITFATRTEKKKTFTEKKHMPGRPYYQCYPIMGTWIEVSLYGEKETAEKAMSLIRESIIQVNNTCSRFNIDSELSKLNDSAADKPFKCSAMLWEVLIKSKHFYEVSGGTFDITIAPLMELWGFFRKQDEIPTKEEIEKTLKVIGLDKVVFNEKDKSVFFKYPDIKIDLGGIAKGYAIDVAFKTVEKIGIKAGVINLGGNIRCFPESPPGRDFYVVGVRDPFVRERLMQGTIEIKGKALATSGDYEQYIEINGERYTHIINPKTGYPVKNISADTVLCKSALYADVLSTIFFLNGEKFAEDYHRKFPEVEILIVKGYRDKPESIKVIKFGDIWEKIEFSPESLKAEG